MRVEWLYKNNTDRVILFFNGWGMDATAVAHLQAEEDVLSFCDYRSWDFVCPDLSAYRHCAVVAWSMGVWAASRIVASLKVLPEISIALNGTTRPVDNRFGIPVKVYELTEKGMNEKGREKFFSRMFDCSEEKERFARQKPNRLLSEVCEELSFIRKESQSHTSDVIWNKCYLSEKDLIFPIENQKNWCRVQEIPVVSLPGGHYPFYCFNSWREIIEG